MIEKTFDISAKILAIPWRNGPSTLKGSHGSVADAMAVLYNADEGLLIASRLRVCERPMERIRGLLGTLRLGEDEAVWIRPCNSIHTFFMLLTIDVAFLDEELRVVKLIPRMTPWRICLPVRRATSVLEGPVGMNTRGRLRVGARVEIRDG